MSFGGSGGSGLNVASLTASYKIESASGNAGTISGIMQNAEQIKNAFGNVTMRLDGTQFKAEAAAMAAAAVKLKEAQLQVALGSLEVKKAQLDAAQSVAQLRSAQVDGTTTANAAKASIDAQRLATADLATQTKAAALAEQQAATARRDAAAMSKQAIDDQTLANKKLDEQVKQLTITQKEEAAAARAAADEQKALKASLDASSGSVDNHLAGIGKMLKGYIEWQISMEALRLATTGLMAALEATVGEATKYEQALQRLQANSTLTADETDKISVSVRNLAVASGASMDGLINGYRLAASEGLTLQQSNEVVTAGMKSSMATGSDLASTINLLSVSMHLFGNENLSAAKMMDLLHQSSADSRVTMEEWVSGTQRAYAVGNTFGQTAEQISAALAAITRQGYSINQSSTLYVQLAQHIAEPGTAATKTLEEITKLTGVDLLSDFTKQGLAAKGMSEVLMDVNRAAAILHDDGFISKIIPGNRGAQAAFILTGAGAADYATEQQRLNAIISGSATPTQDAYNKMLNTTAGQIGILKQEFTAFTLYIGTALLPVVKELVHWMQDLLKAMGADFKIPGLDDIKKTQADLAASADNAAPKVANVANAMNILNDTARQEKSSAIVDANNKLDELKQNISENRVAMAGLNQEAANLKKQMDDVHAAEAQPLADLRSAQEAGRQLTEDKAKNTESQRAVKDKYDPLISNDQDLLKSIEKLNPDDIQRKADIAQNNQAILQLKLSKPDVTAFDENINSIKRKIEDLGTADTGQVDAKIDRVKQKIEDLGTADTGPITAKINNLKKQILDMGNPDTGEADRAISNIQDKIAALGRADTSGLERHLLDLKQKMLDLGSLDTSEVDKTIDDLNGKINELGTGDTAAVDKRIEELRDKMSAIGRGATDAIDQGLLGLKAQTAQIDAMISDTQAKLNAPAPDTSGLSNAMAGLAAGAHGGQLSGDQAAQYAALGRQKQAMIENAAAQKTVLQQELVDEQAKKKLIQEQTQELDLQKQQITLNDSIAKNALQAQIDAANEERKQIMETAKEQRKIYEDQLKAAQEKKTELTEEYNAKKKILENDIAQTTLTKDTITFEFNQRKQILEDELKAAQDRRADIIKEFDDKKKVLELELHRAEATKTQIEEEFNGKKKVLEQELHRDELERQRIVKKHDADKAVLEASLHQAELDKSNALVNYNADMEKLTKTGDRLKLEDEIAKGLRDQAAIPIKQRIEDNTEARRKELEPLTKAGDLLQVEIDKNKVIQDDLTKRIDGFKNEAAAIQTKIDRNKEEKTAIDASTKSYRDQEAQIKSTLAALNGPGANMGSGGDTPLEPGGAPSGLLPSGPGALPDRNDRQFGGTNGKGVHNALTDAVDAIVEKLKELEDWSKNKLPTVIDDLKKAFEGFKVEVKLDLGALSDAADFIGAMAKLVSDFEQHNWGALKGDLEELGKTTLGKGKFQSGGGAASTEIPGTGSDGRPDGSGANAPTGYSSGDNGGSGFTDFGQGFFNAIGASPLGVLWNSITGGGGADLSQPVSAGSGDPAAMQEQIDAFVQHIRDVMGPGSDTEQAVKSFYDQLSSEQTTQGIDVALTDAENSFNNAFGQGGSISKSVTQGGASIQQNIGAGSPADQALRWFREHGLVDASGAVDTNTSRWVTEFANAATNAGVSLGAGSPTDAPSGGFANAGLVDASGAVNTNTNAWIEAFSGTATGATTHLGAGSPTDLAMHNVGSVSATTATAVGNALNALDGSVTGTATNATTKFGAGGPTDAATANLVHTFDSTQTAADGSLGILDNAVNASAANIGTDLGAGGTVDTHLASASTAFGSAATDAQNAFGSIDTSVQNTGGNNGVVVSSLNDVIAWIGGSWQSVGSLLSSPFTGAWNDINGFFIDLSNALQWLAANFKLPYTPFSPTGGATFGPAAPSGSDNGAIHAIGHADGLKGGMPGHVAMIGERGPELMYVPANATIIPNHMLPGHADGLNMDGLLAGMGGVLAHNGDKLIDAMMANLGKPTIPGIEGAGAAMGQQITTGLHDWMKGSLVNNPPARPPGGSNGGGGSALEIVNAVKSATNDPDLWLSMLMAVASEQRTLSGPFVDQIGGGPGRGPFQIEAGPGGSHYGDISEDDARNPFTAARYMVGEFINAKRGPWGNDDETAGAMTAAAAERGAAYLAGNVLGYDRDVVDASYAMAKAALAKSTAPGPNVGGGWPSVVQAAMAHNGQFFQDNGEQWYYWCEKFVNDMDDAAGFGSRRHASAIEHADDVSLNSGRAPAGASLFWDTSGGWSEFGHTAIALGDGNVIGTTQNGIGINAWEGLPGYMGWAPPGLAKGGVVSNPTIVKVGDIGGNVPEIIAPQPMMKETVKTAMMEAGMGGGFHVNFEAGAIVTHPSQNNAEIAQMVVAELGEKVVNDRRQRGFPG